MNQRGETKVRPEQLPTVHDFLRQPAKGVAEVQTRFQVEHAQLLALPRREQHKLRRRWQTSLAGIALLMAMGGSFLCPMPVGAGTISVNETTCTLVNAITTANSGVDTGGCTGGSAGADTINVQTDVTLSGSNNATYGNTGLPVITSEITIEGGDNTISRTGAARFRLFAVASSGDLTLKDATVSGGYTEENGSAVPKTEGGGIYNRGTLTVQDSTISGNTADHNGNGIFNNGGSVTVQNSILSGNSGERGGGIYNKGNGTVLVEDSTISGNTFVRGGGVFNSYGTVTIQDSTISGNSASSPASSGGAIDNSDFLTVRNSTLSGNSVNTGSSTTGGGIHIDYGTVLVESSTLTGNSAGTGGGIYNRYYGSLTLKSSLISGNSATNSGSEVWKHQFYGTINAGSHNLFGHSGEVNTQAFYSFTPSGTDINATSSGTDVALDGILHTTLANNGSLPLPDTHALVIGSPAIDKIPVGVNDCVAGVSTDERGAVRAGGVEKGGLACDIGAFEDSSQTPNAITRSSFDAGAMPPGVGGPLLAAGTAILGGLAAGWAFVRKRARAG